MAYRWEKNISTGEAEIVIDGWEKGIADSPHLGIADMRNINNDSIPGVAMNTYKLKQISQTPITDKSFTADFNTGIITISGPTALIVNQAVVFTGADLPNGIVAGTTYWTGAAGFATTLYTAYDPANGVNTPLSFSDNGTGTMTVSTINMGTPKYYAVDTRQNDIYILDSNGRVWVIDNQHTTTPILLSGNTLTNGNGNGIAFWKDYLFVFRNDKIDVFGSLVGGSPTWTNGWQTLYTGSGVNNIHQAKACQDDILYYCDDRYLGSIKETAGSTFAPGTAATYTYTQKALTLPYNEKASYIEEQIVYLVIGTSTSNLLYPWDRTSTSYTVPIPMPEIGCYKMLNINRILYILAGQRGNIYYTNGSTVILFKTLPKQPTGTPYPLITWGGIMSLNNNLCFGATDVSRNAAGCYAITLAIGELLNSVAGAIRYKNIPSSGLYNPLVLIPMANGIQYYSCQYNGTYGVVDILDYSTPTFYSNYEPYIETDIIPVGTALQQKTFNTVEFKLDTPLTNGEKIRLNMRSDLNTAYTNIPFNGTTETVATATFLPIDGSSDSIPIQYQKWIQLKIEMQTTGSSNSFVRLKEIRVR